MVAVSFGDYATSLLVGTEAAAIWPKLFASGVVLAMAALNVAGARGVDKAQSAIVVALLAVFAVFILATRRARGRRRIRAHLLRHRHTS